MDAGSIATQPHTHQHSEQATGHHGRIPFSLAGALVTLGIIFGDIGTSPLYVMKAIIGTNVISETLVYGGVSCVFWTLLIITTVKYVYAALNADNHGEGGVFALYALARRFKRKWIIIPAIIGCAALIADGFITPPISIASAIEGLQILDPTINTVPIVVSIIVLLFVFQQAGTELVGKTFGPIMMLWFAVIAFLGVRQIMIHPEIFKALNPTYAIEMLVNYPRGFWILGAVFLCTTGGEALYSDLGHCGKANIRFSWSFVIFALLLNYLGQSAWLMGHVGQTLKATGASSVFYAIVPEGYLTPMILLAGAATIIASQALISGCFTLVNEAMKLKLWINMKVNYPSKLKGQIYIPAINWFLMFGCLLVVAVFQKSEHMEAAYGLAIIFNMLATSVLLLHYKWVRKQRFKSLLIVLIFIPIELAFLVSNFEKFSHGGWFTLAIASFLMTGIWVLYEARNIRSKYSEYEKFDQKQTDIVLAMMGDETIPKEAGNLVYMVMSKGREQIDTNVLYSLYRKRPKRADVYWFVHVDILDDPTEIKYCVDTIVPEKIFFVKLGYGYKVPHKVNRLFHEIVKSMRQEGEIDELSHYHSLRKHGIPADFKFILLNTRISADDLLTPYRQWIVRSYRVLKKLGISPHEAFGLEIANIEYENVPIHVGELKEVRNMRRV